MLFINVQNKPTHVYSFEAMIVQVDGLFFIV